MTTRSTTRVTEPDTAAITEAARILAGGGLVAFPTETVYGLGADATNGTAVARLYEAKGRPAFNPLIAHVSDVMAAQALVTFDHAAAALAAAFWPGPLTLVLPKAVACPVAELATAGLDTLAVRMPDHPVAHAILKAFGKPIVAPSANRSGHVSPTTAAHVQADLAGRIDLIVDGGPTQVGVESTIVACLGEPMLLRPGGVPRDGIERVLGHALEQPAPDAESDTVKPLAPALSSARRCANRLTAASIGSPSGERFSTIFARAASAGDTGPNASNASPGSARSALSRSRVCGA